MDVANFLADLFEKGASYSAVNTARSALSSYLTLCEDKTVGSHPVVCRLVKGVFEKRPSLPKYQETWEVDDVLSYLDSLPDIDHLSLKDLTLKTCMLLALLTGQRGQALHSLKREDIKIQHNKCVIVFSEKQKHSKPGVHLEPAHISAFPHNSKLCVVNHLKTYLDKTKDFASTGPALFKTFVKPHVPVSRDTISRWVKQVMSDAGINTDNFGAHSTRSASTSAAAKRGLALSTIMKSAGWSSSKTFTKFYNKCVLSSFSQSVLDNFVKPKL